MPSRDWKKAWVPAFAGMSGFFERAARIDPDIWVVEIEHPDGASFLTEPVRRGNSSP
jgi:hypothetical protein